MSERQVEFERIALPHLRSLARFARRLSGSAAAADDLVQETYLRAWRAFGKFDRLNPRAWLFRILINTHLNEGRRGRCLEIRSEKIEQAVYAPDDRGPEILQALGRLPEEQRTVLLLNVVEGFTCQETANILAVPIGTVMSRLSRGRQAMRSLLAPRAEPRAEKVPL
ncbi:MAG TPA: sigma-70 family RNA polymerase sigma factor [Bryobacteraceae bacterium]|nr:sigma-70 family RNA polymerase sigma factor [Bryobacteraceae bacterium]